MAGAAGRFDSTTHSWNRRARHNGNMNVSRRAFLVGMALAVSSVGLLLADTDPFLKANGLNIRNGRGAGDIVPLRGANLGGWLLFENWMCPMDASGLQDHYSVVTTLISRFGTNTEESLI